MAEVIESAVPDVNVDTVVESPESNVDTVEQADVAQESAQDVEQQDTQEAEGDGRQMSAALKSFLKELQQTNPREAKRIRGDFYALQQIRQSYPGGLKDIQKVAQVAEAIGGPEGLQQIEAERAEWEALDSQFSSGDPAFVQNIATQDPEAFKQLVPHAITQFAKLDPEGYDHLMAGIVIQTIEKPLQAVYAALMAGDDKAKASASELAKWYNGVDAIAKQKPVPKVDPEREKLGKEREAFEAQKAQEFHQSVVNEMRTFNTKQIDADLMAQLAKAGKNVPMFKKQNNDSYQILMRNCNDAIQQILDKDTRFVAQFKAMLMSGDKPKALQLAQSKIKMVSPEAVKRTLRAFLAFGGQPKAVAQAGNNGSNVHEVQLSKQPDPKDIDRSRTTNEMIWAGKAYLKNRKEMVRF